jgi:signal transduction histidine kinase
VTIDLVKRDGQIVLLYEDDGIGFDPAKIKRGYGLNNIETRAQSLSGTIEIDSAPGKGMRAIVEIPVVYA